MNQLAQMKHLALNSIFAVLIVVAIQACDGPQSSNENQQNASAPQAQNNNVQDVSTAASSEFAQKGTQDPQIVVSSFMQLTKDGSKALASKFASAFFVDLATGQKIGPYFDHPGILGNDRFVARLSPDENLVVTGKTNDKSILWNARTGNQLCSFEGTPYFGVDGSPFSSPAFSADSSRLVTVLDSSILISETKRCKLISRIDTGLEKIKSVEFDQSGTKLVASDDKRTIVTNIQAGQIVFKLNGSSAHWNPKGDQILSVSERSVFLWDAQSGQKAQEFDTRKFDSLETEIRSAQFSPDGSKILALGERHVERGNTGNALIWNSQTGELIRNVGEFNEYIQSAAFNADSTQIASITTGGNLAVWSLLSGETKFFVRKIPYNVDVGAKDGIAFFQADSKIFFSVGRSGCVWDFSSVPAIKFLDVGEKNVRALTLNADGSKMLMRGLYDTKISLIESSSGKTLMSYDYKYAHPIAAEFSHDETKILIRADSMKTTDLWDAKTGQMLFSFPGRNGRLTTDGLMVGTQVHSEVRGSLNDDFKLWDAIRGTEIYTLKSSVSLGNNLSFDFSPDSSKLVLALGSVQKGTYTYHELSSGKLIGSLKGPDSSSPRFSTDGGRIIADADDGRLYVWNLNEISVTNPIIEPPMAIPNAPYWVRDRHSSQLSPDGSYVLSSMATNMALVSLSVPRIQKTRSVC